MFVLILTPAQMVEVAQMVLWGAYFTFIDLNINEMKVKQITGIFI